MSGHENRKIEPIVLTETSLDLPKLLNEQADTIKALRKTVIELVELRIKNEIHLAKENKELKMYNRTAHKENEELRYKNSQYVIEINRLSKALDT